MGDTDQQLWDSSSHERVVEGFYGRGVENYDDFHGGYLNFGLWEEGVKDYLSAAQNLVRRLGEMLGLDESSHLLDVGCGMGAQDVYLHQTFGPRRIDALDVTWKHVQHGRRRAREAGCDASVRFHHGTATSLPFPDNTFTHVLSVEAPEHFRTRERFFGEAVRVLRPGGVIAMADYSLKRAPRSLLDRFVVESARRLWHVPRENVDTAESYGAKMERAGFEKVEIKEVGALTIPGYYFEQRRPETIRDITRIRGFVAGRLGGVIDLAVYKAFQSGLMEYILVRAEKGGAPRPIS